MKYTRYDKNKMVFWIYADKVVIAMTPLQTTRYDIYTTANKRNFYTFKKSLVDILKDEDSELTVYDVMALGQKSRIHSTAASRPE